MQYENGFQKLQQILITIASYLKTLEVVHFCSKLRHTHSWEREDCEYYRECSS